MAQVNLKDAADTVKEAMNGAKDSIAPYAGGIKEIYCDVSTLVAFFLLKNKKAKKMAMQLGLSEDGKSWYPTNEAFWDRQRDHLINRGIIKPDVVSTANIGFLEQQVHSHKEKEKALTAAQMEFMQVIVMPSEQLAEVFAGLDGHTKKVAEWNDKFKKEVEGKFRKWYFYKKDKDGNYIFDNVRWEKEGKPLVDELKAEEIRKRKTFKAQGEVGAEVDLEGLEEKPIEISDNPTNKEIKQVTFESYYRGLDEANQQIVRSYVENKENKKKLNISRKTKNVTSLNKNKLKIAGGTGAVALIALIGYGIATGDLQLALQWMGTTAAETASIGAPTYLTMGAKVRK